tara:strand:+ start:924 stop:1910 length:987 start_codon:yes stop_codon:yes gene_type:complete
MTSKVNVAFGENEDFSIESSLIEMWQDASRFHQRICPHAWDFDSAGLFVQNFRDKVGNLFQNSCERFGIESEVDVCVKHLGKEYELVGATYVNEESSQDRGIFELPWWETAKMLYGSEERQRFSGMDIDRLKFFVDHELRHHLDLNFLRSQKEFKPSSSSTYENFLFKYALMARQEGFASYELPKGSISRENLKKELSDHTKSAKVILDEIKRRSPLTEENKNHIGMIVANGPKYLRKDSKRENPSWWQGFSCYTQGPKLMEVIGTARLPEGSHMTEEQYKSLLHEVKDMPLQDFVQEYYQSLHQLGFDRRHAIYPQRATMRAIEKRT